MKKVEEEKKEIEVPPEVIPIKLPRILNEDRYIQLEKKLRLIYPGIESISLQFQANLKNNE